MNEIVQVEEVLEEKLNDEDADASTSSSAPTVDADQESEGKETSTIDDARLTGTALLKSLLSTSTASTVAPEMITTTEVTDEKLNLRKILYQPDREKKDDKEQNGQLANTSDTLNDDDDRLVIDISDEEKDANGGLKANGKSMPSLNASAEKKKVSRVEAKQQLTRQISRLQESKLKCSPKTPKTLPTCPQFRLSIETFGKFYCLFKCFLLELNANKKQSSSFSLTSCTITTRG